MSTITFSGMASGFDAGTLINQLVAAEKAPEMAIQSQQAATRSQISTLGDLIGRVTNLGSLMKQFGAAGGTQAFVASSSGASVGAVVSGATHAGSYSIETSQLARAQSTVSSGLLADSAGIAGAGSLTLTPTSGAAITIAYDGTDTLSSIASKINAQAGGMASASVLYDGSAYRLVVDAKNTGAAGAITFADTGSALGLAASGATLVTAQDAIFKVNGLPVTRSSNAVSDVIPGVTLSLTTTNVGAPATVTVSTDGAGMANKLQGMIDAFNSIVRAVNAQTIYTGTTLGKDTLFGDPAAVALRRELGSVMSIGYGAANRSAGALGITIASDGTLSLDASKLTAAMSADPNAVDKLLSGDSKNGLVAALSALSDRFAASGTGSLTLEKQSRADHMSAYAKQISDIDDRAERMRSVWTNQFATLDQISQQYKNQASYLTQLTNSMSNNK